MQSLDQQINKVEGTDYTLTQIEYRRLEPTERYLCFNLPYTAITGETVDQYVQVFVNLREYHGVLTHDRLVDEWQAMDFNFNALGENLSLLFEIPYEEFASIVSWYAPSYVRPPDMVCSLFPRAKFLSELAQPYAFDFF